MTNKYGFKAALLAATASTLLITGCEEEALNDTENVVDDSPVELDSRALTLSVTDAPIDDALEVNFEVSKISLKSTTPFAGGKGENSDIVDIALTAPVSFDLLELQGAKSVTLLENIEVPGAVFNEISFTVNTLETNLVNSEGQFSLVSSNNVLLLNGQLDLSENSLNATIDIDLRQSLKRTSDGYAIDPVVRVIDNASVGALQGTVFSSSCSDQSYTNSAMYIYPFDTDEPNDFGAENNEPITSSLLNESLEYEFGYLPAGFYRVSLVCDAANDSITADDELEFVGIEVVKVRDKLMSIQNFPDDDQDDDFSNDGNENSVLLDSKGRR